MSRVFSLTILRGAAAYLYEVEGVKDPLYLQKHGRLSRRVFNSLEEMNAFSLGFEIGQRDTSATLADDLCPDPDPGRSADVFPSRMGRPSDNRREDPTS